MKLWELISALEEARDAVTGIDGDTEVEVFGKGQVSMVQAQGTWTHLGGRATSENTVRIIGGGA